MIEDTNLNNKFKKTSDGNEQIIYFSSVETQLGKLSQYRGIIKVRKIVDMVLDIAKDECEQELTSTKSILSPMTNDSGEPTSFSKANFQTASSGGAVEWKWDDTKNPVEFVLWDPQPKNDKSAYTLAMSGKGCNISATFSSNLIIRSPTVTKFEPNIVKVTYSAWDPKKQFTSIRGGMITYFNVRDEEGGRTGQLQVITKSDGYVFTSFSSNQYYYIKTYDKEKPLIDVLPTEDTASMPTGFIKELPKGVDTKVTLFDRLTIPFVTGAYTKNVTTNPPDCEKEEYCLYYMEADFLGLHFSTYLMFKPSDSPGHTDSFWVPIKKINWVYKYRAFCQTPFDWCGTTDPDVNKVLINAESFLPPVLDPLWESGKRTLPKWDGKTNGYSLFPPNRPVEVSSPPPSMEIYTSWFKPFSVEDMGDDFSNLEQEAFFNFHG